MSEAEVFSPTSQFSGASSTEPSAGSLLREARQAAGIHIAALAVALKVPVKKLEAIEGDRFELLPDVVFVRALASSMCRTLKIDPAPILQRLPQTNRPPLAYRDAAINTPFRAPSDGPGPSVWSAVSRPAMWSGFALLLAAFVLFAFPTVKSVFDESNLAGLLQPDGDAPTPPRISPRAAGTAPIGELMPSGSGPLPDIQPGAAPSIASLPAPVSATLATDGPSVTSGAFVSAPGSTDTVLFSAKSESWVEVIDARGQVVLRRTLSAGEVAGVSGALPLVAVVGRADAMAVQVRGKSLDLVSLARNNVARFEVK